MVPKNTIIETKENVENYYKDYNFYQRVYNRIFHHVSNHYYESFFKCEDDIVPFLKKTDNCYLEGWWQYKDIAIPLVSMIQKEIIEIDKIQDKNIKEKTNRIDECESVAIHVRRGDYLKYSKLFGNICTDEYYKAAIKYSFKRIKNLFSLYLQMTKIIVNYCLEIAPLFAHLSMQKKHILIYYLCQNANTTF